MRTVHPSPPEELRRREGDEILPIALLPRRGCFFGEEAVALARSHLALANKRPRVWRSGVGPRIRERLRGIVDAWASWERAKLRAKRDAGEVAADRAVNAVSRRRAKIYAELGCTPARTLEGVLAKLSVAAYDVDVFRDEFVAVSQIEHVMASAVLDAVELVGDSATVHSGKPAAPFVAELRAFLCGGSAPARP